jgi:hypothetical protein
MRTRARGPGSHPPIPAATSSSLRLRETCNDVSSGRGPVNRFRAGTPTGQTKSRQTGLPVRRPGSGTPQLCLSSRLPDKSACRLAKMRKRPQLGEVLPIPHPAPFTRLAPVDPRSTTARTGPRRRPTRKSPFKREVLEAETLRAERTQGTEQPVVRDMPKMPAILRSITILTWWARGVSRLTEHQVARECARTFACSATRSPETRG